ncbi:hypothetical protein Tco_1289869, partial [Tanacetum coccineum]
AENMKRMGHDIVQDSIWEQYDDSEEDHEEDDDEDTFDMWDIMVEDHWLLNQFWTNFWKNFGDDILNVTMVDDEADFNPTKDLEELKRLLAKEP